MLIEEYLKLAREEFFDISYNMDELVELAWDREVRLGSYSDEEPMKGNDVND
jgi:hypothetical protein